MTDHLLDGEPEDFWIFGCCIFWWVLSMACIFGFAIIGLVIRWFVS